MLSAKYSYAFFLRSAVLLHSNGYCFDTKVPFGITFIGKRNGRPIINLIRIFSVFVHVISHHYFHLPFKVNEIDRKFLGVANIKCVSV